jgi:hypothetical protein
MSWSLSMSGHTASKEDEAALIADLRTVVQADYAGTGSATMYTQHHGQVNLMEADPDAAASEAAAPAVAEESGQPDGTAKPAK